MATEHTPLLGRYSYGDSDEYPPAAVDPHEQFCMMVGIPSSAPDADQQRRYQQHQSVPRKSLYGRVTRQLRHQTWTYYTTASLSNAMLLSQVVLGAALTALGASESSHILITVFGAMNTVIAGLVAYLKSRGQPMRARMYRDDLERVVDEIENSEVMWLGISRHVHGYDEIDTDDGQVSVRSEVARLTRLYDRAVRNNTINNPDMYMANGGGYDGHGAQLRSRPGVALPPQLQGGGGGAVVPIAAAPQPVVVAAPVVQPNLPQPTTTAPAQNETVRDPDESPATAPPKPKEADDGGKKEQSKKETDEDNKDSKADNSGGDNGTSREKDKDGGKDSAEDTNTNKKEGDSSSSSSSSLAPKGGAADPSPVEGSSSQPQSPPTPPTEHDPDASPASDPNVPLKKT
ncbi:hypothetical protein PV08_10455 [Exophiala spinifera]|uniref:SMODS and SLOG-associating 2TM effector domain-containing protein n=1 Tax=Exophiala spinifera TaxID=91928 RepID=A0A0D2AXI4_9EURO|nr:uncharacterized protein PV08_10455 [Exophiala spinifera]KIW11155.1 hypothetical protein PV08_10455 [Exophiala spinifera]